MSQNQQDLLTKIAIDAQKVVSAETAVLALVEQEAGSRELLSRERIICIRIFVKWYNHPPLRVRTINDK
jgi:hypothetical protein